jgi:hypothetical protein
LRIFDFKDLHAFQLLKCLLEFAFLHVASNFWDVEVSDPRGGSIVWDLKARENCFKASWLLPQIPAFFHETWLGFDLPTDRTGADLESFEGFLVVDSSDLLGELLVVQGRLKQLLSA